MAGTSAAENLQQCCVSDLLPHLKLLICDSLKNVEGLDQSRIGLCSLKFNKKLSIGDLIIPAFIRTCFGDLSGSEEDVSLSLSVLFHLTPEKGNELLSFSNEKKRTDPVGNDGTLICMNTSRGFLANRKGIDHFTVVVVLPGLWLEARLPVTLF